MAPCARCASIVAASAARAAGVVSGKWRPPSEKESGVRFRMDMMCVRRSGARGVRGGREGERRKLRIREVGVSVDQGVGTRRRRASGAEWVVVGRGVVGSSLVR